MGRKFSLFAAAAALVIVAGACTAPPALQPALVVNTTADTFDGVCDATDCSLRDAIVAHNNRPADPTGVPGRISLPTGTYALSTDTPLTVTKPLIIGGANSALTTLDITGSTVASPGGVFAAEANIAFTGFTFRSDGASPAGVLASCDPTAFGNRTVSILNSVVTGLEAATSTCASVFVSTTVTGPAAVLDPVNVSASSATIPLASGTLSTTNFSFVSSILTGPSDDTGSTDADVTFTALTSGVPTAGSFTGTRAEGLSFTFGDGTDVVNVNSLNSSFGLDRAAGPAGAISTSAGSSLRLLNSTVYGGGPAGAITGAGAVTVEASTIADGDVALALDAAGSATVRRSVLASTGAATCGGAAVVTSLGYNLTVGTDCGTPTATDQSVATQADVELGALARHGGSTPSLAFLPAPTSPVVDVIPPGTPGDLDCPTQNGEGRSLDQRGVLRPVGAGCDVGSVELRDDELNPPAP